MEGPEIKAVEAVIDNGSFGKRTLRFETGRLAQQADGAVAAYLDDDSMILSTTTAGSSPKGRQRRQLQPDHSHPTGDGDPTGYFFHFQRRNGMDHGYGFQIS